MNIQLTPVQQETLLNTMSEWYCKVTPSEAQSALDKCQSLGVDTGISSNNEEKILTVNISKSRIITIYEFDRATIPKEISFQQWMTNFNHTLTSMGIQNPNTHTMKEGTYTTVTKEEYSTIIGICEIHDIPYSRFLNDRTYKVLHWDGEMLHGRGDAGGNTIELSVSDFTIQLMMMAVNKPKTIQVQLNSLYTAYVTKDHVKVGCQTFPMSVMDKINDAIQRVRK